MAPMEQWPTGKVQSAPSEAFCLLDEQFKHIQPPYSAEDIRSFNRIYRKVYRELSAGDRKAAEHMVDQLIAGVERPEYAPLIFGVF